MCLVAGDLKPAIPRECGSTKVFDTDVIPCCWVFASQVVSYGGRGPVNVSFVTRAVSEAYHVARSLTNGTAHSTCRTLPRQLPCLHVHKLPHHNHSAALELKHNGANVIRSK